MTKVFYDCTIVGPGAAEVAVGFEDQREAAFELRFGKLRGGERDLFGARPPHGYTGALKVALDLRRAFQVRLFRYQRHAKLAGEEGQGKRQVFAFAHQSESRASSDRARSRRPSALTRANIVLWRASGTSNGSDSAVMGLP